jgi:hypothetical protein
MCKKGSLEKRYWPNHEVLFRYLRRGTEEKSEETWNRKAIGDRDSDQAFFPLVLPVSPCDDKLYVYQIVLRIGPYVVA